MKIVTIIGARPQFIKAAAVSYADAFIVAAAVEHTATIVTGDPEFKETESLATVLWLRT